MPSTLGNDESVATESYRYMMVPSREASPLEMIHAKLTLEGSVGVFGSPLLLDQTY